mmetsp:Transcript_85018/g.147517  ORF Transcript_85018/g.147517 Transcript_85018/m.147517 type:complete len:501 (+) Transcript_85018:98-1600(+)
MKLDATVFRYITKEEFRIMTAIEMGMRNHELVPVPLIESIAKLNRGGTFKIIQTLLRHKLVAHENKKYDGYRLTYLGFDFLALRAMMLRGSIIGVGRRLGVGKESDVHYCQGANGETLALKLHRLGRISFRSIKKNRDYMRHRSHGSWMYMARLAAVKEFAYMKALYDEGFPVPTPIDQNRHCVVMSLIDAVPMYTIKEMPSPHKILERLMRLLIRLGRAGIIHGDYNEFNLMIGNDLKVTLIDFPQIVHLSHPNARELFDRDVRSICEYFRRRCDLEVEEYPTFDEVLQEVEADGGAVLSSLEVQGLGKDDDALLVAAHGVRDDEVGEVLDDDDEGADEEDVDAEADVEEEADATAEDAPCGEAPGNAQAFDALVPEGGREELLVAAEEEEALLDISAIEEAVQANSTSDSGAANAQAAAVVEQAAPGSDEEDEASEASEGEGPGAVTIHSGKKVRKKQSAKEARKNLQKQQKAKPARANNQKAREARKARHDVKEYFM